MTRTWTRFWAEEGLLLWREVAWYTISGELLAGVECLTLDDGMQSLLEEHNGVVVILVLRREENVSRGHFSARDFFQQALRTFPTRCRWETPVQPQDNL